MIQNLPVTFRFAIALLAAIGLAGPTVFLAGAEPDDNQQRTFIVAFHELPEQAHAGGHYHGGNVVQHNENLNYAVVETNNPNQFTNDARNDRNVRAVDERTFNDPLLERGDEAVDPTLHTPTDPSFGTQYGPGRVRAPEAWDTTLGQTTKNICVVDTGVRYTHEDIAGARWLGGTDTVNDDADPWDDDGHGTHVTGTAAGTTNNGVGISGIAQVGIYGVKGIGAAGTSADMLADGVDWCTNNGADIISMSWRWQAAWGGQDLIRTALENAAAAGILLIAAAGNNGCEGCVEFPSTMDEVMSVSCTDSTGAICWFSSTGPEVDISAPGDNILATCFGSDTDYCNLSGTSMSTPHVSGVAGLIWSYAPSLTAAQVRQVLEDTAEDLGTGGFDNSYGHGEVDAKAALDQAVTRVLNENFDDGSANGWSSTGMWHVTSRRANTAANSLWYGQESTGNYDNGATNSGTSTTPSVTVPDTDPKLAFKSWYQTESGTSFDQKWVEISNNGGSTWTSLLQVNDAMSQWNTEILDLSAYAGQSIQLRFRFDTIDSVANNLEGWYVDDVQVTGTAPQGGGGGGSLNENFDDGSANGWSLTGFWHVTSRRPFSSPFSLWYGQESTGNYDNGATNSGSATTPSISIGTSSPTLTFQSWYSTESGTSFDQKWVEISNNGGSTWSGLLQINDAQAQWNAQSIDLSAYAGQSVLLRFRFDTVDSISNNLEGWYVDDVHVSGGGGGGSLDEDFDDGSANGWSLTGFWHVTSRRSSSSPNSLWYGQEATGNYDNGATNSGTATTPSVTVPNNGNLVFNSWYSTESGTSFDQKWVEISSDGGFSWSGLLQIVDTQAQWNAEAISLSSYVGQSVMFRFRFDTVDSISNNLEGWYVDDVQISETVNQPPSACFIVSPSSGSTSTSFSFDASCSSDDGGVGPLQVRWDWESDGFWDTSFTTTKTASHQYGSSGSKTITLEVKDAGGLTDTTTGSVFVNNPPNPCFTATPTDGMLTTTFQFNASCSSDDMTSSGSLQVRWDFENDGVWDTSFTTTKTASKQYSSLGAKTVRLEVLDGHGATSQTTRTVVVHLLCVGATCVL